LLTNQKLIECAITNREEEESSWAIRLQKCGFLLDWRFLLKERRIVRQSRAQLDAIETGGNAENFLVVDFGCL
jgi:hypothetical protein